MKTLKGLLTAVLALSMSTGFAAPSVGEQTFQATDNNPEIQIEFANYDLNTESIKFLGYDHLSESGQKEADKAIAEFCATAPEDITYYQNKLSNSRPYMAGSAAGLVAGFGTGVWGEYLDKDANLASERAMRSSNKALASGTKNKTTLTKARNALAKSRNALKKAYRVSNLGFAMTIVGAGSAIYVILYRSVRESQIKSTTETLEKFCKSPNQYKY